MAEIDLIKISELPATSTIGDADELAVVQGGATKKVPYSALKAGAEVTPDTTLSEAGVPADAAAVGAALALKANQAAVTQALATKADSTEVAGISGDIAELASVVETKADQTALNQKADKTTTDALRQDLTTLNGIVSQKADKTELNTQIGNVTAELATKANTADVNNLLAAKANVASPVFTGRPQAPTAAKGTATLQLATTAFVQNAIDDKQDTLTFDAAPTQGSTNPVTSGGVYTALEDAKDDAEEATAEAREIALKAFATPTASGQLITLTDGADGIPAKTLTLTLSPHQEGSGDPSPENVRPISGYTAVKVTRAGKNLLPYPYRQGTVTRNGVTFTNNGDGSITLNGTATERTTTYWSPEHTQSGRFIASGAPEGASSATYYMSISTNGSYVRIPPEGQEINGEVGNIAIIVNEGQTVSNITFYPMLRSAEFTDATFEPYTAQEYTFAIPSEAGAVYGGTLTINGDGSGTLTVTHKMISRNSANMDNSADYPGWRAVSELSDTQYGSGYNGSITLVSSVGTSYFGINTVGSNRILYLAKSVWGLTQEEWIAKAADIQIVIPLATPTTYTLTASQVTTLLGDNTLWMDADGSIDLVYRADTEKYVERRIAEVQALVLENNG